MGLSFAIPVDVAINVKNQLVAHGSVTRGRIGVRIQEVDQTFKHRQVVTSQSFDRSRSTDIQVKVHTLELNHLLLLTSQGFKVFIKQVIV